MDNASTNTDCEAWLVTALEKKLKRKLHTIDCSLHKNEFPFRTVFKYDGTTKSLLEKLCANDYQDFSQLEFNTNSVPLDNLHLTAGTLKDLSGDQRLLIEYAAGIFRGESEP